MAIKRIDHIAIAIEDMRQSLGFWEKALGLHVHAMQNVPEQAVDIAFLPIGQSEVELVRPVTDDSGIAKWMSKRGPGIHHMAVEVHDVRSCMQSHKDAGLSFTTDEPSKGLHGSTICFLHPKSTFGVMTELVELAKDQ